MAIPDDVIVAEILPRLPAKSLLIFMSVSESWHSSISSNQLIKSHLSKPFEKIILNYSNKLEHSDLRSPLTNNRPIFDVFDTSCLFDPSKTSAIRVRGSCDGLILLQFDRKTDLMLWNPSTRKFKKLPPFPIKYPANTIACGIGFDKHTDDYKVVVFYRGYDTLEISVFVYSLRTSEWTRARKNCPGEWFICEWYIYAVDVNHLVFANGKLHWFGPNERLPNGRLSKARKAMYFDVETEEFGELKVPEYDVENIVKMQWCVSQECLYLIYLRITYIHVWIVEGYELGKETFTKLSTLPISLIPMKDNFYSSYIPWFVFVEKNGEILFQDGRKLLVFDTNHCTFKYLDITLPTQPGALEQQVFTYVES